MSRQRRTAITGSLLLACAATVTAVVSGSLVDPATALTTDSVPASADTLVRVDTPTTTYAHRRHWAVDGRPGVLRRAFLTFEVPAPPAGEQVTRLVLSATVEPDRLSHVPPGKPSDGPGPVVHRTSSDWTEDDLTWENQPALGPALATSDDPHPTSGVVRWDVTAGLSSAEAAGGGVVSFGLDSTDRQRLGFQSRESGTPAELMVTYGSPDTETDTVVWAVGDVCDDKATAGCAAVGSMIAADPDADAVLGLGDLQYEVGSLTDYLAYYDPKMGRGAGLFAKTLPAPGNHEYKTAAAAGYFAYWGARAGDPTEGYHATTVGGWTVVAANSNCDEVGGCGASSPQGRFLASTLASAGNCALVFDHHPAYTDGKYAPGTTEGGLLFDIAHAGDAELFLSGHDHNYQRFAPRTASGALSKSTGVRQFVVGTGGKSNYGFTASAREFGVGSADGALRLTLRDHGYRWEFTTVSGQVLDSGTGDCH